MIGEQVSHYRVLSKVGSGGMGEIYEAEDLKLGRRVALKFLPAQLARDHAALERFQREARAASALNHPNICTIYAIEEHGDHPFLAMELLEGASLDRSVHGIPLELRHVLEIGIQAADALEAAHEKGIIHRDIKPANLFQTSRGVKVLDFGLAKLAEDTQQTIAETTTSPAHLTSPGTALGTIAYMSPEQARGEILDRRTDIFSLGAVLYEIATAKHPFPGSTSALIFDKILHESPVAPVTLNPRLPGEFERILNKALEKDRDLRYQSAAELRADLKRLQRDVESGRAASEQRDMTTSVSHVTVTTNAARPSAARASSSAVVAVAKQHKLGAGVAALISVLVIAAAAFGVYSLLHRERTVPFRQFSISKMTQSGKASRLAMSPDAKYLLYVEDDHGMQSLWLRNIPSNSTTQVIPPGRQAYRGVKFSPDGNFIYFVRNDNEDGTRRGLFRAPVLGGAPTLVVDDIDSDIALSPDGTRVAFLRLNSPKIGEYRLLVADVATASETEIAHGPVPPPGDPTWSPDGNTIVCSAELPNEVVSGFIAYDVRSGKSRIFGGMKSRIFGAPAWYPDGKGLIALFSDKGTNYSRSQLAYVSYPDGEAREITSDTNDYKTTTVATDGLSIATILTSGEWNVDVLPAKAADDPVGTELPVRPRANFLSWIDENHLVTDPDLVISQFAADSPQLTPLRGSVDAPSVMPTKCGDDIVFSGGINTGTGAKQSLALVVFRMNARGGDVRQISHGPNDRWPRCSADGKWILWTAMANGSRVVRAPAEGSGEPQPISRAGLNNAGDVSSDGKLAVIAFNGQQRIIQIVDIASGRTERELKAPLNATGVLRFAPGGTEVAVSIEDGGNNDIVMMSVETGAIRKFLHFSSKSTADFAFSPDGSRIALVRGKTDSDVVLIREQRQ